MNAVCILCDGPLDPKSGTTVTVGKKGISTIKEFSDQRKDGISRKLRGLSTVQVHSKCRNEYTKRLKQSEKKTSDPQVKLRSESQKFDFKTCCFLCGIAITAWELKTLRASRVTTLEAGRNFSSFADKRNDTWGVEAKGRIESVEGNLFAADARYHQKCNVAFRDPSRSCPTMTPLTPIGQRPAPQTRPSSAGRKPDQVKLETFAKICEYLENNDECQFSIQELVERFGMDSEVYSARQLRRLLENKYGDSMIFAELPGNRTILSFKGATWKALNAKWYSKRLQDEKKERLRIMELAGKILRDDVRSKLYDCDYYPTPQEIEEGGRELVPETLMVLLETVIKTGRKTNEENLDRICLTAAHTIISATRPRSFLSPIQIGLGIDLHKRFGSRSLLDYLNAIGVCCSYNEVAKYESAVVLSPFEPEVTSDALVQFVFDNADFNIKTIDGHGTFHCMGGITCITPASSVRAQPKVRRALSAASAPERGKHGYLPVKPFVRARACGLDSVEIRDLRCLNASDESFATRPMLRAAAARKLDILWLAGFGYSQVPTPSWHGFCEMSFRHITEGLEKSAIYPLPFVNLNPSNPTAIYTCLEFAAGESRKRNNKACVVTFDQPLFQKAIEIVLQSQPGSPLRSVNMVLRLGGFHTLMSFLGSIGYIMAGSGLEEVWQTVYAKNTVPHMLSGKAYSRSVRGHILLQAAFYLVLLDDMNLQLKIRIQELMEIVSADPSQIAEVLSDNSISEIGSYLQAALREAKSCRTSKLWVQYSCMVDIVKSFLSAERLGDWSLHLQSVRRMIPYFHAAGHLNYARSAHLYVQQMEEVELQMSAEEYHQFVVQGYFTISRSGESWSGVCSDMVIEQNLMKYMKSKGAGVTSGRGITASTLATMVRTMPLCSKVSEAVEKFTGNDPGTSEQHKDLRVSSQDRDKRHFILFSNWLRAHSPLNTSPLQLVSVATGVVADTTVTCDKAEELGNRAMSVITGKMFGDVTMSRKFKVVPLSAMGKSIKVGNNVVVPLNVNQIFHRLVFTLKPETLEESLKYELATRPPSLFKDAFMRKGTKSTLALALESLAPCDAVIPQNPVYVVDGGFLLRQVVWPQPATFSEIAKAYVNFVLSHYGRRNIVVFDGYQSGPSTKDEEHQKRATSKPCPEIMFREQTNCITPQMSFLSNGKNKERLISLLRQKMTRCNIEVRQAPGDADTLIVTTAVEIGQTQGVNAIVVGNDTDLLALLLHYASPECPLHMLIPGSSGKPYKVHHSEKLVSVLGAPVLACILFVHAFTGCDSTSAIFRQGKKRALKIIRERENMRNAVEVFNKSGSTPNEIACAGEKFFLALYGMDRCENLNSARYILYKKTIARQPITAKFDIATLPPTTEAARCHSMRVYHQIQSWLGNELPPQLWGWNLCGSTLVPQPSTRAPAPERLMNLIVCNCTSCDEEEDCFCRKSNLPCSPMCGQCAGYGCSNPGVSLSSETDSGLDEDPRPGQEEDPHVLEGEDEEAEDDPDYPDPESI